MRKYMKTFVVSDTSEYESGGIMDHEESETQINKWLEEKYEQVGKTIANFEMLYVEPVHVPKTPNTLAYVLLLVIYTELRL
tara:strand:- start:1910 stop:2152 length:243 start_codon:yes stop_codon:yes gene_type:complete